jgi:trans-aconitate methyltransferase
VAHDDWSITARSTAAAADDARSRLLDLINANWTTQALATAVRLRLCERLRERPMPSDELAAACACHGAAMQRLLQALATLDVVTPGADGRYAVGALGEHLVSDRAGGLGPWAELCGTSSWRSWGRLLDCVRTGQSARQLDGGSRGLGHLEADPAAAALFHRSMAAISHAVAAAAAHTLDLARAHCVVDVGGGTGQLLTALLQRHSHLRGVLFDRPHALAGAQAHLQQAGLGERCAMVGGDFFEVVPAGGDVLLLKSILHDWDDDDALRILLRCRAAMHPSARLAVIERLLPDQLTALPAHRAMVRSDLNTLVGPGGRERTLAAYRDLLVRSDLRVSHVVALTDHYSVVEAVAA